MCGIVEEIIQIAKQGSVTHTYVPIRQRYLDITYIRLIAGWMYTGNGYRFRFCHPEPQRRMTNRILWPSEVYLVAVLDVDARYVVSWALDDTLEQPFVLEAVRRALAVATPHNWNSDQGSHFTSRQYTRLLAAAGVQISMDGKGRALDNIFIERLWRSMKYEHVYLNEYGSLCEARIGIRQYLTHYNEHRPHSSLAYQTP